MSPGGALHGIDWTSQVASAQVKSAILLAGLAADGETVVREAVTTRTHTEEMLAEAGADIDGRAVGRRPDRPGPAHRPLARATARCPATPPQAAFLVVAGCVVPGSAVDVAGIQLGTSASASSACSGGWGPTIEPEEAGQPDRVGDQLRLCRCTAPRWTRPRSPRSTRCPILAVAAAVADGTTLFPDVGELRVKEVGPARRRAALVEAFGATATVDGDTWSVQAPAGRCAPARVDSRGDHRMAMAAAVAALRPARRAGAAVVTGWAAVATSYPAFAADLARLAAAGPR